MTMRVEECFCTTSLELPTDAQDTVSLTRPP